MYVRVSGISLYVCVCVCVHVNVRGSRCGCVLGALGRIMGTYGQSKGKRERRMRDPHSYADTHRGGHAHVHNTDKDKRFRPLLDT